MLKKKSMSIILFALILLSCQREAEVFVSDRHSGSYEYFLQNHKQKDPLTLILLDYHHDMGPGPSFSGLMPDETTVKSFNWLGGLTAAGLIGDIYWVSGRDLLLPNRNSRKDWLERKLREDPPNMADTKRKAIHIIDWSDLIELNDEETFDDSVALSLDLDILTVDPGDSPDSFLDEMLDFIEEVNPEILTVAFSSAYQKDPSDAWKWLAHSLERLGQKRTILLAGGEKQPHPEGNEEYRRWMEWEEKGVQTDFSASFAPGASLWNRAPAYFWQEIIKTTFIPADETMNEINISLLRSLRKRDELKEEFPEGILNDLADEAGKTLTESFDVDVMEESAKSSLELKDANRGLAVRFISRYEDRGCIAYYRGIGDPSRIIEKAVYSAAFHDPRYEPVREDELLNLDVEITLFGSFSPLSSPDDFIPSLDSLILEYEGERTLLQASLAQERNLSRTQFLRTLARKSGLGEEGWTLPGVILYRAPSLSLRTPVYHKEK